MKKVISLHVSGDMYAKVAKLQGEALIAGHRFSQQEILRGLLDFALDVVTSPSRQADRAAKLCEILGESK